jgi:hypothetical protein
MWSRLAGAGLFVMDVLLYPEIVLGDPSKHQTCKLIDTIQYESSVITAQI